MKSVKLLLLGASRLVGLCERFLVGAQKENVDLQLFAVEDESPWHAISASGLCRVLSGPRFLDEAFGSFLLDLAVSRGIDLVLPCIDTATVGLSRLRDDLDRIGSWAVVSTSDMCEKMWDKALSEKYFGAQGLSPPQGLGYPRLAKPRFGSSSRNHAFFNDDEEYEFWRRRNNPADFIVQQYVPGTEYTVDAFVDYAGRVVGACSRVREVVSGGEVMVTRTDRNERVLELSHRALSQPGWRGPITIQVIEGKTGCFLIEINPRFGGGVPCSIEAGLEAPRWILRELLGRPLPSGPVSWQNGLTLTRARKDYFLWSS